MKQANIKYANKLWGVFSFTAFCVYSWSLIILFWDMPSYLLRYSIGDILGLAAYQLMFALLECITVTLFIAALSTLLPARYLKTNLRASGSALVIAFAINAILFKERGALITWVVNTFSLQLFTAAKIVVGIWAFSLVLLPIGFVLTTKIEKVEQAIHKFVENLSVLVSLYVFLSVLGIILVFIRNLR